MFRLVLAVKDRVEDGVDIRVWATARVKTRVLLRDSGLVWFFLLFLLHAMP